MSRIGRGRHRSASPQITLDALLRKLSHRTSLILPAPGTRSNRGPEQLRLVRCTTAPAGGSRRRDANSFAGW